MRFINYHIKSVIFLFAALCLGFGGFGLGLVSSQGAAPVAPVAPAEPEVALAAKKAIEDAFNGRIQALLACLPKDATSLDKMRALRPLWDEERQWHIFFESCLYTEELRMRWRDVGPSKSEHPVQFVSLDAKFCFAEKNPKALTQHDFDIMLIELPKVHLLRRELAREILTKVIRTLSTNKAALAEIWPVDVAPEAKPTK